MPEMMGPSSNLARYDRFGNERKLIAIKTRDGKEYGKGYLEIAGQLYKVEVSPARKDNVQCWVTVTKLQKRKRSAW